MYVVLFATLGCLNKFSTFFFFFSQTRRVVWYTEEFQSISVVRFTISTRVRKHIIPYGKCIWWWSTSGTARIERSIE